MIRLLVILIIFVFGYGSLFYFFNNAGNLSLVLGMWQLSIPVVQFFICFYYFSRFINFVFLRLYQAFYLSKSCLYAI